MPEEPEELLVVLPEVEVVPVVVPELVPELVEEAELDVTPLAVEVAPDELAVELDAPWVAPEVAPDVEPDAVPDVAPEVVAPLTLVVFPHATRDTAAERSTNERMATSTKRERSITAGQAGRAELSYISSHRVASRTARFANG